jgi:TRAP-type C4-dicarboxylate transport system permease small subunit
VKISFKNVINNFEEIGAGFFLIVTTVLVLMNVFLRYFFNMGIIWSEEVATGCFVWSVFLGSAACYKRKLHVGVDMLLKKFSKKNQDIINFVIYIILLVINGSLTLISIQYLKVSARKPTPVLGISSAFISSSIFVGFLLMTIYTVLFLISDIKSLYKDKNGGVQC